MVGPATGATMMEDTTLGMTEVTRYVEVALSVIVLTMVLRIVL